MTVVSGGHTSSVLKANDPTLRWATTGIYRIEIASDQTGTDNGTAGGDRDTDFNSGFVHPSFPQLCTLEGTGISRAYSLLNANVPEYDLPVVLVNALKFGGSGGPISGATADSSSARIVEHEIGHSFVGLSDDWPR